MEDIVTQFVESILDAVNDFLNKLFEFLAGLFADLSPE